MSMAMPRSIAWFSAARALLSSSLIHEEAAARAEAENRHLMPVRPSLRVGRRLAWLAASSGLTSRPAETAPRNCRRFIRGKQVVASLLAVASRLTRGPFPAVLSIFRDAKSRAGQDFTARLVAVQLRLRVRLGRKL